MKKMLIYVLSIAVLVLYPSYGVEKNSYASEVEKRMNAFEKRTEAKYKDREENDYEFRQYITETYDEWNRELNSVYQKIINEMNKSGNYNSAKKHLIQAQREWIKFRDSSGEFKYYLIAGDTGGTMGINPQISEKVNIVKARVLHLAGIYDFITENN